MKNILIAAIIVFITGIASSFVKPSVELSKLPATSFKRAFTLYNDLATAD